MHVEVSVALNFVISYLYNKLPRRRVDMFGEELEKGIKSKFEGHWYDDKPYKGSAYRCIRVSTEKVEPLMELAARLSRLEIEEIKEYLPKDLTLWIDPGEVSYRIGEKGIVKVLYSSRGDRESFQGVDKEIATASKGFNPDAQCFKPIDSLSSSLSNLSVSPATTSPTPTPTAPVASGATSPWGTGSVSPIAPARSYNGSTSPSGSTGSSGTTNAAPIASFLNRNQQNNTMTTAMFAQTKFGSTKLKTQAKRPSRLSPTELGAYIKQRSPPHGLPSGPSCPPPMPQNPFGAAASGLHTQNQGMAQRPRTLSPRSPVRAPGPIHPMALEGSPNRLQHYFMMQQQAAAQGNLHGTLPSGLASPIYGSMTDLYGSMLGPFTPSPSYGGHSNNMPGLQEMFPGAGSPRSGGMSAGSTSAPGLNQNLPSPESSLSHKNFIDSMNQNNLANYPSLQHLLVAN